MPTIIESLNPFKPFTDTKTHSVPVGTNIRAWLGQRFPGFVEFEKPTICICNGQPLLRKDWDRNLEENDVVAFVGQPGYFIPVLVWYAIAAIVVGVAVALLMPKPSYESKEGDSIYSIRGQQNKVRLGEPVESAYGRCRLWPSYGAIPYNRFLGNDQYQYSLFCLGQGSYQIHQIQIEDTPIENFKEVQHQVYEPGQAVTLFDDRVNTSSEVANMELFAPNQPEYESWIGPFVANDSGTTINKLAVDIVFPLGLNHITDKGRVRDGSLSVSFEYRKINDTGDAIGGWTSLVNKTWTLATTTAQRYTVEVSVPDGRYQVRALRTSAKDTDNGSASMVLWGALRGFLPSIRYYEGKTMLAIKMRASNNLNDSSSFRINVWATRKLPIWSPTTGWSAPTATRSIIWAICDIARSKYGGQLPDSYLPLADYKELDDIYTAQGRFFDYVFDQKTTVWEALRLAARIGRAVPMLEGSQIQLIRDVPRSLPTALFNQNNIKEESFKWNISLPKDGDYDGVLVEYTDPNDFLPRQIKCLIGDDGTAISAPRPGHSADDTGYNLEEVKLLGCTDRDWAFREGCYYRSCKRSNRQSVAFSTGLEGHLPRYGSLIGVSHDLPEWASGGSIVAMAADRRTLTLSEPVAFEAGATHYIGFELKDGSSAAPQICTAGVDNLHVVLSADAPSVFVVGEQTEPPVFLFGKAEKWSKNCVLTKVTPSNEEEVAFQAYVYDPIVYINDSVTAPALPGNPIVGVLPKVPTLKCNTVRVFWAPNSNTSAIATWEPALGAFQYELWKSVDSGASWSVLGFADRASYQFPCNEGFLRLRVRPIGVGIGDWCESNWTMEEGRDPWAIALATGELVNQAVTVPANADGSSPVLSIAVTWFHIYVSGAEDTDNWSIVATPSAGVTGTLVGNAWTTTAMTTDAASVTFTASKAGFENIVRVFTLAKAKAGTNGSPGTAGLNNAMVFLYKRATSTPAKPTTVSTYTFASAILTGHDGGWTQAIPANNGNPLYVIAATASSTGTTDTIAAAEWSSPVVLAANGANGTNGSNGANGLNSATVMLYQRAASTPALPSADTVYTFSTKALTGITNGWSTTILTANGTKLWVTTATATSTTDTDTIAASEWAAAAVMAEDGPAAFTLVNDANCTVGPNWIKRTTGTGTWDAAAHTRESYVGGAFCSFQFDGAVDFVCGLTTDPTTNNSYNSIGYAWHGSFTPAARIFENGTYIGTFGEYTANTVFSIVYDGRCVKYLKDGVVYRTVAAPPNLRLYFDSSVSTLGSKAFNIAFGPAGAAGADAIAYWLLTSASTLKLSGSAFAPTTVTFTGKSQTGTGAAGNYSGRFIIAESTDGANFTDKYTSSADEATKAYTPSATTVRAIRCRFYAAGGTTTQLDEETVPVVVEPIQPFTGGGCSGGGGIGTSWADPGGMGVTLTVPDGNRSVQFSGHILSTGNIPQSLYYALYCGSTMVAQGEQYAQSAGQGFNIALSAVVPRSAGTVSFSVQGRVGVNTGILNGSLIVL